MNGLIISDSAPLQMRFSASLWQITKQPADLASSSRHALDLVKTNKNYQIMICTYPLDQHIQELFDYLVTNNISIPVLFTASNQDLALLYHLIPKSKNVSVISYEKDETVITNTINRLLRIQNKTSTDLPPPKYKKIKINFFKNIPLASHDLYIQCFEHFFQKIFSASQPLNDALLDRYSGYKYFYVKLNDFPAASYHLIKAQTKDDSLTQESESMQTELFILAYHSLYLGICQFGLNQLSIKLLETCRRIITSLALKTTLKNYLKNDWDIEPTQAKHSLYLALVSLSMLPHMSFTANKKHQDIFILASLLYDIGQLPGEFKSPPNETPHPQNTLDLIKAIDNLPSEIEKIILQHHEESDGSGFPMGLKHNMINPLAQIFIVARRFTESICNLGQDDIDYHIVIESLEQYYHQGYFKLAIEALKNGLGE